MSATKCWKVLTPSISKKGFSTFWDWSDGEETRVMEVFCNDLTGHPSYILVRITRDDEKACYDEFNGQLSDGYFEDYRGIIKYKEVEPGFIKLNVERVREKIRLLSETEPNADIGMPNDNLLAVMSGLGMETGGFSKPYMNARRYLRHVRNYWGTHTVTEEDRVKCDDWVTRYTAAYKEAVNVIAERIGSNSEVVCGK